MHTTSEGNQLDFAGKPCGMQVNHVECKLAPLPNIPLVSKPLSSSSPFPWTPLDVVAHATAQVRVKLALFEMGPEPSPAGAKAMPSSVHPRCKTFKESIKASHALFGKSSLDVSLVSQEKLTNLVS